MFSFIDIGVTGVTTTVNLLYPNSKYPGESVIKKVIDITFTKTFKYCQTFYNIWLYIGSL